MDYTQYLVVSKMRAYEHAVRQLVDQQEAALEQFVIAGAMPRDLHLVVGPVITRMSTQPYGIYPQQDWRIT